MDRRSFLGGVVGGGGLTAWWVGALPRLRAGRGVLLGGGGDRAPLEAYETAVHEGVNGLRADAGVDELAHSDALAAVARAHSADMAARDFFAHRNPDGQTARDRLREAKVACAAPGENLAQREYAAVNPTEFGLNVVAQWDRSEGHRKNLLREGYRREGIGVEGHGDAFRLIDRRELSNDQTQVQFSGLNDDTEYRVFYTGFNDGGPGDIIARLNGDTGGTGNYTFWDSSSTRQDGEDEMLLLSQTNSSRFAGRLIVTSHSFNESRRSGFNHALISAEPDRLDDFGREGMRNVADGLDSIELTSPNFTAGNTLVELWGRDYF